MLDLDKTQIIEYLESWLEYFDFSNDYERLGDKYDLIYRQNHDCRGCFCVNVKNKGPYEAVNMLVKELGIELEEFINIIGGDENLVTFTWQIISSELEEIENKYGIEIFSAGRSGGYLCCESKNLGLTIDRNALETLLDSYWTDVLDYVEDYTESEDEPPSLEDIASYVYDKIDPINVVKSETLEIFKREMDRLDKKYSDEYWLDLLRELYNSIIQ